MNWLLGLIFKPNGGFRWLVLLLMVAIMVAIGVAGAELLYGDWRCAFAECRIVK